MPPMGINIFPKIPFSHNFEFNPHYSVACTFSFVRNIFHTSAKKGTRASRKVHFIVFMGRILQVAHKGEI